MRYLDALATDLRARLRGLQGASLDWGFCHGDALGADAHVDHDTLTLFDFDCCGPGWRAYDLATYRWICEWHTPDEAAQRWTEFVDGYQEHRPLAAADLAAVPLCVVLREVWLMGLHAGGTRIYGQFILDDAMLDRRFAFLKTWARHLTE